MSQLNILTVFGWKPLQKKNLPRAVEPLIVSANARAYAGTRNLGKYKLAVSFDDGSRI